MFVEGALQLGEQVLRNVRLWAVPISLAKVLLGDGVLMQVAKIELECGNLRCFRVSAASEARSLSSSRRPWVA